MGYYKAKQSSEREIMFRKFILISLTLIFVLIFGCVSSFASSWIGIPEDPNNPVVRVTYERFNPNDYSAGFEKLSFKVTNGDISGKIILDGTVYDISKTYVAKAIHKNQDGYFVSGTNLYKFHPIGGTEPLCVPDPNTGQDVYGGNYSFDYELIKTNEIPTSSSVLTVEHENTTKVTEEKYYVNEKETTKAVYESKKVGAYKEKTSTKHVKDLEKALDHEDVTFLGLKETPLEVTWSDGTKETVLKALYKFQIDQYYNVKCLYRKTYELTTSVSSTPQKPSINITVKSLTPKAAKKGFTAKWKKVSTKNAKKITGYHIQYSTDKNFKSYKMVSASKKSASKKISGLKAKKYYYVRIRVYKGNKVGPWSAVKKIKTK